MPHNLVKKNNNDDALLSHGDQAPSIDLNDDHFINPINDMIKLCGGTPGTLEAELTTQMIQNSLKFLRDKHDTGQLKLVSRALKEMRYAYGIFNKHMNSNRCISIFGSARTPETHPDYLAAKAFSQQMAKLGWMCITGAAEGIMKAGHEGPSTESAFGLSIKLPFEAPINSIIAGNPRLINFRYFFTRKLMFLSHSDAVAAFPGGVGTMDELFEVLTLIQTGKSNIIPIVLVEGTGGHYWSEWKQYVNDHLLANGWICAEDQNFYHLAVSPEEAEQHISLFYKNYHSSRYVRDDLIIRLNKPLTDKQLASLNKKFPMIIQSGDIHRCDPYVEESDHLQLPRIAFTHTRKKYGFVRALIDELNTF